MVFREFSPSSLLWEIWRFLDRCAGVMELVDVADSKSAGGDSVWVRVPPPAPSSETLDSSKFEPSSVFLFSKQKTAVWVSSPLCSLRILYGSAVMLGSMLNIFVIFSADVVLECVSKWA